MKLNKLILFILVFTAFCSCDPDNVEVVSAGDTSEEQPEFLVYDNLGSFNWTYLIVKDTENLLLVNDDDGKFISSYGIFSPDTVFILSELAEGTLSIDVNNEVLEIVCANDSLITYSKEGRKSYSLHEELPEMRSAVSNSDMLNVLFGEVIEKIIDLKPEVSLAKKAIEAMRLIYETDGMNPDEWADYVLDKGYALVPSDLFNKADKKQSDFKSRPLYYIGIKTGAAEVKGISATCYVEGYLRVDGNEAPYDFEYGICYSTSSVPTVNHNVQCKRVVNSMASSLSLRLPDFFVCSNLESETKYYYRAYFKDNLTGMIDYADEIKDFTTTGICLDNHHPHVVDLGLESGILWSCCNVGANTPEQYGGYYAWGETEEKSDYDYDTYKYYNNQTGNYINIGSNISGTQYDVATVKWGNGWRMPTKEEIRELYDKCKFEGFTYNGVKGCKVTGPNGNSIFLPAAGDRYGTSLCRAGNDGYYWCGSLNESYSYSAWYLLVYFDGHHSVYYDNRLYGLSVRPVR